MIWYKEIYLLLVCIHLTNSQQEKISVTFVIDDTASMNEDIQQVKRGVASIFETVTTSNKSQVDHFNLVTFNDHVDGGGHEPQLLIKTLRQDDFIRKLSLIYVDRGGDCPEMAMSGIELGLKESLPGSYLYVFTDAIAKDYDIFERVLNLAIEKKTQIVFILTEPKPICDYSVTLEGYLVYQQMAKATNGQVFHMSKYDVGEILAYVNETMVAKKEPVISKSFPPGYGHEFEILVDGDMKDVVIAESGKNTRVDIISPDGTKCKTDVKVDIADAKVIKIVDPKPGNYTANVGSQSGTSVVVTAQTGVSFEYGFSDDPTTSMNETNTTPVPGVKSYVSIQLQGEDEVTLHSLQIVGMDEKIRMELPLKVLDPKLKIYITEEKILPDDDLFNIVIKGLHIKSNTNIIRKSRTPIEVQKIFPEAVKNVTPTMEIEPGTSIKIKYGNPLKLVCKVRGYPKPDITWTDSMGEILSTDVTTVTLSSDYKATLDVEKVIQNESFECSARNTLGAVSQKVNVEVEKYFNVLERPKDTTIQYMKSGKVNCKVDASPPAKLSWYVNGTIIKSDDYFDIFDDGNGLVVKKMLSDLIGTYVCIADNGLRKEEMPFEISILGVAPISSIDGPSSVSVEFDTPLSLYCRATGYPMPNITWYDETTSAVLPSLAVVTENNNLEYVKVLQVEKVTKNGIYKCKTVNSINEHSTVVKVEVLPYIKIIEPPKDTTIEYMKNDTIHCKIDAEPPAEVTWQRNGDKIKTDDNFKVLDTGNVLVVKQMLPNLVGEYKLVAENGFKTKEIRFHLNISGAAPVISIDGPSKLDVQYDKPLSLSCQATGHPEPRLAWYDTSTGEELFSVTTTPKPYAYRRVLEIERVESSAVYQCKASNLLGEANANVSVETMAYFQIKEHPKNTVIEYTKSGKIHCKVAAKPPATTIWLRNNKPLKKNKHINISPDNTTLSIDNMQKSLTGRYVCQLSNKTNRTNLYFDISISGLVKPVINQTEKSINVLEGTSVDIYCQILQAIPLPKISWKFLPDGETTFKSKNVTGNRIHFDDVSREDSGGYRCIAKNDEGSSSYTFKLSVEYPPIIEETEKRHKAENGKELLLKCITRGVPQPMVNWFLNSTAIGNNTDYKFYSDHSIRFKSSLDKAGVYNCTATNNRGIASISIQVDYFVPVQFDVPERTTFELMVGEDQDLTCVVDAYPQPTITWLFFSNTGSKEPKILRKAVSPDTLELRSVQLSHDGMYTCMASNDLTSWNMTYTVIVNEKPRIVTNAEKSIEAVVGDKMVRVPCSAIGRPEPSIVWENKDGAKIASDTDWYDVADDGALIIKNIDAGGFFTCDATNRIGSDRKAFHVVAFKYPRPSSPVSEHRLEMDQPGEVSCPLAHTRVDSVRWYKGNYLLKTPKEDQLLRFQRVSEIDEGVYTCRVSSFTSPAQSASIRVILEFPNPVQ